MNKKSIKKENYSKREVEKANRMIRNICIAFVVLALLIIIGYSLA